MSNHKYSFLEVIKNRWSQLFIAASAMLMISNLQYSWTLFALPLSQRFQSSLIVIQYAFTVFVMFQTFVQPAGGYFFDKFGSKVCFIFAGLFVGIGWGMMGVVTSINALYIAYSLSGIGAAIVYSGCVSIAIKWFPDKKGIATGIIVGAYGLGSIPFIPFIDKIISNNGVENAFRITGLIFGIVIILTALMLRNPTQKMKPSPNSSKSVNLNKSIVKVNFNPVQMLLTPHFWLIWTMAFAINVGGLIITANSKSFGNSLSIPASTIVFAIMMTSLSNGMGRIFWGWVSDHIGRAKTMFISFGLNAIFLFILPIIGSKGDVFYILTLMLVMFTWGQLFSLFPSLNADLFGSEYSASNYGFLNSSKGFAAILGGGLGAYLAATYGWTIVFSVAATLSLYACVMSLVLPLLPKPKKYIKNQL